MSRQKIVRKRGHPEGEQLLHYGVEGMKWYQKVTYVPGVGWTGDGVSKKINLPPPFLGRKKQQGGHGSGGTYLQRAASGALKKQAGKPSSSTSTSSAGGSSSGGSKYNAELRAKLDALRGTSEKAQKEAEKKAKEEEAARKKEAAAAEKERKEAEAAAEKERKAREAEENKAYKQRLSIERQARQLFDRWKQEELRKSKKKDNTLKKSQVTMVADRGQMKSWIGPRRSRSNKMK